MHEGVKAKSNPLLERSEWQNVCETMLRGEEEVCEMGGGVCALRLLRLRGSDAKFRLSSLQRLIEYQRLRGNISYCHAHVHTHTHLTSRSVMVVVYTTCEPSRLKWACFFSLTTKARSLGAWPSIWWPSLGKVILVPSFHPFFTSTSNTRSSGLNVCLSVCRRRVTFTRFVTPSKMSSNDTRRSWTSATPCGFSPPLLRLRFGRGFLMNGLNRSSSESTSKLKNMCQEWASAFEVLWEESLLFPGGATPPLVKPGGRWKAFISVHVIKSYLFLEGVHSPVYKVWINNWSVSVMSVWISLAEVVWTHWTHLKWVWVLTCKCIHLRFAIYSHLVDHRCCVSLGRSEHRGLVRSVWICPLRLLLGSCLGGNAAPDACTPVWSPPH